MMVVILRPLLLSGRACIARIALRCSCGLGCGVCSVRNIIGSIRPISAVIVCWLLSILMIDRVSVCIYRRRGRGFLWIRRRRWGWGGRGIGT